MKNIMCGRCDVLENLPGSIDNLEGLYFEVSVWKLCVLENIETILVLENMRRKVSYWKLLCRGKVNVWKLCSLDNLRVLKNNIRNGTPEMWRFYGGFMEIL